MFFENSKMLSIFKFVFFQAPAAPQSILPSASQKTEWSDHILKTFRDALDDDAALKKILLDGLFAQKQGVTLTEADVQELSIDDVLQHCISKTNQFSFRECNLNRVLAYFNQLNLFPEIKNELSELKQYKVSLAIYHAFTQSSHGRVYDELMINANMHEAVKLLSDKKELEQNFLNQVKIDLSVTSEGFVLI